MSPDTDLYCREWGSNRSAHTSMDLFLGEEAPHAVHKLLLMVPLFVR